MFLHGMPYNYYQQPQSFFYQFKQQQGLDHDF